MTDTHPATAAFRDLLRALGDSATNVRSDYADDPQGQHWLDLDVDGVTNNVVFRADHGYGLYLTAEDAYGANPDEVTRDPVEAARRLREVAPTIAAERAAAEP